MIYLILFAELIFANAAQGAFIFSRQIFPFCTVRVPMPGPTSSTTSAGSSSASSRIRPITVSSTRKFCPSLCLVERPNSSSTSRVADWLASQECMAPTSWPGAGRARRPSSPRHRRRGGPTRTRRRGRWCSPRRQRPCGEAPRRRSRA